jgi:hypothetical protein
MKVVAVQRLTYASRTYQPGEEFEAEESHGKLLIQYGNVRAKDKQKLETASVKAEPEDHQAETPPNRRTYKRRDMRAEN